MAGHTLPSPFTLTYPTPIKIASGTLHMHTASIALSWTSTLGTGLGHNLDLQYIYYDSSYYIFNFGTFNSFLAGQTETAHKPILTSSAKQTTGGSKGQLISKCPFGVFKSPKKPTKFL